jgi:CheY-like chemotaxis protein
MSEVPPILLVDDDADIREALSETLRDEGFVVSTAGNGQEAICWLRDQRPASCVILLDLMMPVMDGSAFLREKRADPALVGFPVVLVTASAAVPQAQWTPDVRACLGKPIEMERLLAAIRPGR